MIDREDIINALEEALAQIGSAVGNDGSAGGGLFPVDVKMSAGDGIEVFIDSDGVGADGKPRRVTVDDCVMLTKAIEARFDRDEEDFSLTVSSAGVGQPLRTARQYRKLIGKSVEVVLNGGAKITATLEALEAEADNGGGSITLSYPEKQKIEGKKRPETVTVTKTFALNDVKTTKEHIDFK